MDQTRQDKDQEMSVIQGNVERIKASQGTLTESLHLLTQQIDKQHQESKGRLPLGTYVEHFNLLMPIVRALKKNNDDEENWRKWSEVKKAIHGVNKNNSLPESYNIPQDYLKRKAKLEDRTTITGRLPGEVDSELNEPDNSDSLDDSSDDEADTEEHNASEVDSGEDEIYDDDLNDTPEGLARLVSKKYQVAMGGDVVGYRTCGVSHYQCLVAIKNDAGTAQTYRLVPGSQAGAWNTQDTTNLAKQQYGQLRKEDGNYKYSGKEILRILAVAWQLKKEAGNQAIDILNPRRYRYLGNAPQVYVQVM